MSETRPILHSENNDATLEIYVRNTRPEDFPAIVELCRRVYPETLPWGEEQLASHLQVFPEGQLVAVERAPGSGGGPGDAPGEERLVGMAASLILSWDDYEIGDTWRDFTDHGMFTNHDPQGRTLYGAEVMVDPRTQGQGVGSKIYDARRELVQRLGLRRIRAGARLRGYRRYADRMSAREYVERVVAGEIRDATLTFQLNRGFRVLKVVSGYLKGDPASQGWAAVIEWLNPEG
jgi:ribosomal protein S18 acetylase RimI-like enzyme